MTVLKINVLKILKEHLFKGQSGTYLDCVLHERPDEYGNAGFITQDVGKEARLADPNARGPIIGNFRVIETKKPVPPKPAATAPEDDEIPF